MLGSYFRFCNFVSIFIYLFIFSGWLVDPVDAPGYYKVIKTPMDFGTVRAKLEVRFSESQRTLLFLLSFNY